MKKRNVTSSLYLNRDTLELECQNSSTEHIKKLKVDFDGGKKSRVYHGEKLLTLEDISQMILEPLAAQLN